MRPFSPWYVYNPDLRRIIVGGEDVGDITWKIHREFTPEAIGVSAARYESFRSQIPQEQASSVQYLADLHVWDKHRGKGYGRAAMLLALQAAKQGGAEISFLRVGWHGDDWEETKNWLTAWYQRLGFILLTNEPEDTPVSIPYLWRPLSQAVPEPMPEVSLEADEEPESPFVLYPS